jgi:hypothetical protein
LLWPVLRKCRLHDRSIGQLLGTEPGGRVLLHRRRRRKRLHFSGLLRGPLRVQRRLLLILHCRLPAMLYATQLRLLQALLLKDLR